MLSIGSGSPCSDGRLRWLFGHRQLPCSSTVVRQVELVADEHLGIAARPPDRQRSERVGLFEHHRVHPVQLQDRQEAGHGVAEGRRVVDQVGERHLAARPQRRDHEVCLVAHAHGGCVQVCDPDLGLGPRFHRPGGQLRERLAAAA